MKRQLERQIAEEYIKMKILEPCSICESWLGDVECDNAVCPVKKMKDENKRLKSENKKLKARISKLISDSGWEFENKIQKEFHEVDEW